MQCILDIRLDIVKYFLVDNNYITIFPRLKKRISEENQRKLREIGDVVPVKGSRYVIASRGFVDFILHDDVALKIREILRHTGASLHDV